MSHQATAPTPTPAIRPQRVMVLDEYEQQAMVKALRRVNGAWPAPVDAPDAHRLAERVAYGTQYTNPTDELVRRTLRKRRLEEEVRRENRAITDLEEQIVQEWADLGRNKDGHEATGATLHMTRRVWAKLDIETDGLDKAHAEQLRADQKARVGEVLTTIGLGGLVRPDFNLNTLSAVFREQIKDYDAEQRELPEHERAPRAAQDFLPEALQGLLRLDDTPHITVRA